MPKVHTRKKMMATVSRNEGACNQVGDPSVPFYPKGHACEKGGRTARVTDFSAKEKSERTLLRSDVALMVNFNTTEKAVHFSKRLVHSELFFNSVS